MQSLINRLSSIIIIFITLHAEYETEHEHDDDVPTDQLTIKLIMKTSLDPDITSSLTEDEKL